MQSVGQPQGQTPVPTIRETQGHQSGKMLGYVVELIYTEQKYIEDMREFSSQLESLLEYQELGDSDRIIIQNYKALVDNIVNTNELQRKIPLGKNIYDKIEAIFDELEIPQDERREKIQTALPILRKRYVEGIYNDLDEKVMDALFNQTLSAFNDPAVLAYINTFEPLIANATAFREYIGELATRCPIDRSLVTKLVGSESYSIKPTQRCAKYQMLLDPMRHEVAPTDAVKQQMKEIATNDSLTHEEKQDQTSALLKNSNLWSKEKQLVESTSQTVLTAIFAIDDKRKSVTALDLSASILLDRTRQAYAKWQASNPGADASFTPVQARLSEIGKKLEAAQIRTDAQILNDARNKPPKACTRNELLLKQILEQRSKLQDKYKKQLAEKKTKLVFSKKKKGLKRKVVNNKYQKAIVEMDTIIMSLKKQIELDDKTKQVSTVEAAINDLVSLNKEASEHFKKYGSTWPVGASELQAVQSEVVRTKQQIAEEISMFRLTHKDMLNDSLIAAKQAFKDNDYLALQFVLTEHIRIEAQDSTGKKLDGAESLKLELNNDIAKIRALTRSISDKYAGITILPLKENAVQVRLYELKRHANKDSVGIVYNKWDRSFNDPKYSDLKALLEKDQKFKDGLAGIKKTAEQIVTIEAQITRLDQLRSELLDLQKRKFGLSYHYDVNRGQLISRLVEQLSSVDEKSARKGEAKALKEEIKALMESFDNDKSIDVLIEEIDLKKKELKENKDELVSKMKEQDRQLEVYSANVLAQNQSMANLPLTPKDQILQAERIVTLLVQDSLFKLDSVIKQLEFERSKYQIESQFSRSDRKHVSELDEQIIEMKKLYETIANNHSPSREKMHAISDALESVKHKDIIKHIITDYKLIKSEYDDYFKEMKSLNDGLRTKTRDTDHLTRYSEPGATKYDKTSIVVASLDHAAKSYKEMIMLLKAQQHFLVGDDARLNEARIKKYENAYKVIDTIFTQLNYSKKQQPNNFVINQAIINVFEEALAGKKGELPVTAVRLFKDLKERSAVIVEPKKRQSFLFKDKPKVTKHITAEEAEKFTFKPKK